jgi:HD-GYP domain-containing protein (c-di-GMP phosphodiesterase class II)
MVETVDMQASEDSAFIPVSLTSLRVDSMTSFDIYFQPSPGQPFVLYSERNLRFTEDARKRLVDNNVATVYIRNAQRLDYRHYVEENLPAILTDPSIKPQEKSDMLYSSASVVAESLMENPESVKNLQRSREIVKHTVNYMLEDRNIFMHLLGSLSSVYAVYTHSVNVVTYSVALAQRTGENDPATLRELAIGALLHDVGKSKIDSAILNCHGTLTSEQWETMKRHPDQGHAMLVATGIVSEIALDIVRHHHEKIQGGGYPDNLKGNSISRFVRITAIVDIFDALTTDRLYQKARTSFAALKLMRLKVANDLDPDLFRIFVGMMGHPSM